MDTPIDRYIETYSGRPRPGLTKDVAFNRLDFDAGRIHNPAQGRLMVGTDELRVELVQDFSDDQLQRVCSYAINATLGIDPDNPPEPVDWEEMLKGGLQTALEDFRISFALYGVSRTATHQIVRTRRAAFHQQSQRAHFYGDRPSVRMPESWLDKWVPLGPGTTASHHALADRFRHLAEHAALVYREACEAGVSYQDARFALLEGTVNFILWEGSLREFIDTYAYRACSMFQWEISWLFREMRRVLVEHHPYLDKYVKISCEKTHGALDRGIVSETDAGNVVRAAAPGARDHTCTFQGWEEVEGQCDFPWARESNRTFRSERHAITKGR